MNRSGLAGRDTILRPRPVGVDLFFSPKVSHHQLIYFELCHMGPLEYARSIAEAKEMKSALSSQGGAQCYINWLCGCTVPGWLFIQIGSTVRTFRNVFHKTSYFISCRKFLTSIRANCRTPKLSKRRGNTVPGCITNNLWVSPPTED